jgi:hypothetical protein
MMIRTSISGFKRGLVPIFIHSLVVLNWRQSRYHEVDLYAWMLLYDFLESPTCILSCGAGDVDDREGRLFII